MFLKTVQTFTTRQNILCDEDKRPKFIAGVPPDNFSATGQIWGNPLYIIGIDLNR